MNDDEVSYSCRNGTCGHNVCPGCGATHAVPAGYSYCRSCTFGRDSREGRIDRAWSITSGNSDEQSMAVEDEIVRVREVDDA